MANNETKVKETAMAQQQAEVQTVPHKFFVEREKYSTKDGNEYWAYILKGKIRRVMKGQVLEQEVKVNFVAKDQGGYEVLDIIFFGTDSAELVIRDETMTNDKTGEVSKYKVYELCTTDDNGEVFSYKVKLQRESDKALLDMLIKCLNAATSSK